MSKHIDNKNKYDYEVDLSLNTSTGIILDKIKPGSTVLEFGCATGRMTRYMRDELLCKVYIVEINAEAYEVAIRYAEGGLCSDAADLKWVEAFNEISFDYIVFADVLEHIVEPERVVGAAANMLAPTGNILVSIPNVTNNDVLIKAFYDHFDYTDIGLLDDSHVHFWGYENLQPFAHKCGLRVIDVAATYVGLGQTEQGKDCGIEADPMVVNLFRGRRFGNVYQFVFCMNREVEKADNSNPDLLTVKAENQRKLVLADTEIPGIEGFLYFDYGQDFDETKKEKIVGRFERDGVYIFNEVINKNGLKRLRFDPVEGQECILVSHNAYQGNNIKSWKYSNADIFEEKVFLHGTDPFAWIDIDDTEEIILHAEVVIQGREFLEITRKCLAASEKQREQLNGYIVQSNAEIDGLKGECERIRDEVIEKDRVIAEQSQSYEQLNICFEGMKGHADLLQNKVNELDSRQTILIDTLKLKEKEYADSTTHINNLQSIIDTLRNEIEKTFEDNRNKDISLEQLKKEVENNRSEIENNRVVLENNRIELEKNRAELERNRAELEINRAEIASNRLELENNRAELEKNRTENEKYRIEFEKTVITKNQEINLLQETLAGKNSTIAAYAILANNKDEELLKKKSELCEKIAEIEKKEAEMSEKAAEYAKEEAEYKRIISEKDSQLAELSRSFANRAWRALKRLGGRK